MINPKHFAKILKGRLVYDDQKKLTNFLKSFKDEQPVQVVISRKFKKRTSGQIWEDTNFNGYYWGVMFEIISKELGYFTKEERSQLHEWIQINVGNVVVMKDGKEVTRGTSEMSGMEFAEFCKNVRIWASRDLEIYLPEPHEAEVPEYY